MPIAIITHKTIYPENNRYIPTDTLSVFCCNSISDKIPSFRYTGADPLELGSDFQDIVMSYGVRYQYIRIDEIVRFERKSNETLIHLRDKSTVVTEHTIAFFFDKLKENQFYSVHADHLVNLLFMERLTHSSAYLTLSNFDSIPVSPEAERELDNFLENSQLI